MCFNGLSQARPDLTGGIYAYAAAGFGDFVGFNSAWGYWVSACLSNVSFAILLFSALGYFFHPFESGNNLLSCVCASAFLWLLVWLVSRGVKEAAGINVIVTIAKLVPLSLFVLSIALLGKFDPAIFMENFWGEAGGPDLGTQIVSTMIALVWVFTGIEGAVVISGRAKYARDVGRATAVSYTHLDVYKRQVVAVVDVPQVVDAQHHEADPRALHRLHTTTHIVLELELVEKSGQRVDLALLSQVRDEPGEQQRLSLRVEDEPAAASQTHPFAFAVDGAILHPMARRARIGD